MPEHLVGHPYVPAPVPELHVLEVPDVVMRLVRKVGENSALLLQDVHEHRLVDLLAFQLLVLVRVCCPVEVFAQLAHADDLTDVEERKDFLLKNRLLPQNKLMQSLYSN